MRYAVLVVVLALSLGACHHATAPTEPELVFTADLYSLPVGGMTTLRWTADGVSGCWIEPIIGNVPCSGSKPITFPLAGFYTYTLHGGMSSQTVQIQVK